MGTKAYIKSFLKPIWIILIYTIIAFVPLAYSNQFISPYQSTKTLLFELLLYLSILFLLFNFKKQTVKVYNFNLIDFTIILHLLFLYVLTGSFPRSPYLPNLTLLTLFYFLIRLFLSSEINKYENIIKIFTVTILASLIECIIVFYEIIFNSFPQNGFERRKPDIYGTLGNPNIVAIFLAACLPFLFLLFQRTTSKAKRIAYGVSIIFLITIIVLSLSRGTWLALITGLLFYFYPQIKSFYLKVKSRTLLKFGSALIITFLLIVGSIAMFNINNNSIYGRLFLWRVTGLMIQENILSGIGYGNFPIRYLDFQEEFFLENNNPKYLYYASDAKYPNNEYLQIFAETGVFGLILFLAVFVLVFKKSKIILKSKKIEVSFIGRATLSSLCIILVHCFFDNPLRHLPIYMILFLNLAVISHLLNQESKTDEKIFDYSKIFKLTKIKLFQVMLNQKWPKKILNLLLLFFFFLMPYLVYNTIIKANAYHRWQNGVKYTLINHWEKAIKEYNYVLNIFPENGRVQFYLGAAYLNDHNPKKAVYYLNKSLETYSDKNIYISLGYAYSELSEYNKAISVIREFENKFPNLILPHLLLGKVYLKAGKLVESKNELEFVIKMKPKFNNQYASDVKDEATRILKVVANKLAHSI